MDINVLEILEKIRKTPSFFLNEFLGVVPWEKQIEIVNSIFQHPRTAVKSCNSAGKSFTAATATLAFLYSNTNSIVVTTAPTGNQVFNVLWREIRGLHNSAKIPLGGELMKQRLELDPNWYALGFSTDNPDNARGFHAKGSAILIICDEAQGIPPPILDALEGNLTSGDAHILYIGNPTIATGRFHDAFSSPFFNKISISAYDTPNFMANGITSAEDLAFFDTLEDMKDLRITHPYLVTPQWAFMRMHEWGVDSPMFQSLVEAKFPVDGERMLIPLHFIERALRKEFTEEETQWNATRLSLGVDVAKGNFGDNSVITALRGYDMQDIEFSNSRDPMELVGMVIRMFNTLGGRIHHDTITVDDTSLGGGVVPRLTEQGYRVNAISFGAKATVQNDTEKYANIKAEMFWKLREVFREDQIKILDKGKLIRHCSMMQYDITSAGAIKIVSKDVMKSQGYESSDFADSLALAVWGVVLSGQLMVSQPSKKHETTLTGNLLNKHL